MLRHELCKDRIERCDLMAFCLFSFCGGSQDKDGEVFFFFLQPHQWSMEVPGLGVESELQLLAYARATATLELNGI